MYIKSQNSLLCSSNFDAYLCKVPGQHTPHFRLFSPKWVGFLIENEALVHNGKSPKSFSKYDPLFVNEPGL
jgi:hypothetical protein